MKEQYYNDINTSCHWKTLAPFCLQKKTPENAFLTLTVNYRRIIQKEGAGHEMLVTENRSNYFYF